MSGKYTLTYDASEKVKKNGSHAKGLFRHIARYEDQQAGFEVKLRAEKNRNLDATRSHLNVTFVNDGDGGYRELESVDGRRPSDEFQDYLDTRLSTVKRKFRPDAVVMRPLILQIDPKWFAEHNPDWKENGVNSEAAELIEEQLAWAAEEFGQENIVGGSLHLDEKHPQLHVLMTPVTDDGRLAQKQFFKGPGDFQRQRKDYLDRLHDAGYEPNYRESTRSKEHLSSEEFQAKADDLDAREAEIEAQEADLLRRETELLEQRVAVRMRESAADEREAEIAEREREVEADLAKARRMRSEGRTAKEQADSTLEAAEAVQTSYRGVQQDIQQLSTEVSADIERLEGLEQSTEADRALTWMKSTKYGQQKLPDGSQKMLYDVYSEAERRQRPSKARRNTFARAQEQYGQIQQPGRPPNVFQPKSPRGNDGPQLG